MDFFEKIKNIISDKIPIFITSLFIFIIFVVIGNIIRNIIINNNETDINVNDETNYKSKNLIIHQIGNFVYYLILIIGITFAVIKLGFDMATIITIFASIGLALGIAMQGTLNNIISGIIIILNNTFSVNDIIKLNNIINEQTTYGKVIDFNLYVTIIYNPLKKSIIHIPNSVITNNLLTNVTRSELLNQKN
jgi:small conductance mechanosensitive channel